MFLMYYLVSIDIHADTDCTCSFDSFDLSVGKDTKMIV